MPLPPYQPEPEESRASMALTIAVSALLLGVGAFVCLITSDEPLLAVFLAPLLGLVLLVAAVASIYFLRTATPAEGKKYRSLAWSLIAIIVLGGLALVVMNSGRVHIFQ